MESIWLSHAKKLSAVLVASFLLYGCSAAQPIIIDFEGRAGMTFWTGNPIPENCRLGDQMLEEYGVVFSSGEPYVAVVELGAGHAASGVIGISGARPGAILTYAPQWPVAIEFFDPTGSGAPAVTECVSWRGDMIGSGVSVTLNAYGIDGQLLDSATAVDEGGTLVSVSGAGIHRVEFLGANDNAGMALDDLTFSPLRILTVGG